MVIIAAGPRGGSLQCRLPRYPPDSAQGPDSPGAAYLSPLLCSHPFLCPHCPFSSAPLGSSWPALWFTGKGYSAVTSLLLDKLCKLSRLY